MGFNVGAGLAGGLVGGLGAYESILKEDRSASAERVKLEAQQDREEHMARLKQARGREDYTFKAEEDARLKNSPDAIAARDAEDKRKLTNAIAVKEAEYGIQEKAGNKADAKLIAKNQDAFKSLRDNYTPKQAGEIEGLIASGVSLEKAIAATKTKQPKPDGPLEEAKFNRDIRKDADLLHPLGVTDDQDKAHAAYIAKYSYKVSRVKKDPTVGQLKKTAANKELAEEQTSTIEDLHALAMRVADGDPKAKSIADMLSKEKREMLQEFVTEIGTTTETSTPLQGAGVMNIRPTNQKIKYQAPKEDRYPSIRNEAQKMQDYKRRQAERQAERSG